MAGVRRKPVERRAELIAATADVMLSKGFAAATTRDVTRRAGVGSGLLNHYFSWEELRCLGFEAVARRGTAATFPHGAAGAPVRALRRFVRESFAREADPWWRAWAEATDAAASDRALARTVEACAEAFRVEIESVLRAGSSSDAWSCSDPAGAAWRILAMHDGLMGFVFVGAPALSRRAARAHLRKAVDHELQGAGWR